MKLKRLIPISLVYLGLAFASAAHAFDMGNMMNPSKWMDNDKDKDRYDDYYDEPGYGYPGGPPGYGYGGPGYGYGGPGYGGAPGYGGDPGYGGAPAYGGDTGYGAAPDYGYGGAPGYGAAPPGYGGAPGYGAAPPGYGGAPAYGAQGAESREAEIRQLKERLRQLESGPR